MNSFFSAQQIVRWGKNEKILDRQDCHRDCTGWCRADDPDHHLANQPSRRICRTGFPHQQSRRRGGDLRPPRYMHARVDSHRLPDHAHSSSDTHSVWHRVWINDHPPMHCVLHDREVDFSLCAEAVKKKGIIEPRCPSDTITRAPNSHR